ncbi:MAG TPA: phosphoribosyltransferase family protein [Armatimonadota bacterium]|jgi:predicted phosphoribosyltransferase
MLFRDRNEAGQRLAHALAEFDGQRVVVYALPRGGVVLGVAVAKALHAPLDLLVARKIGHPDFPEYAICAVSEADGLVCNEQERARVDPAWFAMAVARERQEAARRRERYLTGRPSVPVEGKIAILIDDGIATGLTMRAAIAEVKTRHPSQVIVAIPVIPPETAVALRGEVDRIVALEIPEIFRGAVGAYYQDFHPVTDDEVMRLMREASA